MPPLEFYEAGRHAMGDTRRYAERMRLIDMEPRRDVASTGYALVNKGKEYLVLEPSGSQEPFEVDLPTGRYAAEWFGVTSRTTHVEEPVAVETAGRTSFTAPFEGPAVLYLTAR